jgi:L-aspartate semialdehyde sulfurtransferase
MAKTIQQINEKIRQGKAVVVTAEEIIDIVENDGPEKAAEKVDVVTTATFGPMCSSGAFINFGHTTPKIKASKVWFNDVPAYAGIAAVDAYLGATELAEGDPENKVFPGEFRYGGGHVITELLEGKRITMRIKAYGTDCYPAKDVVKEISLDDLPYAQLYNPRNGYQNYACAVNLAEKTIYTYMGILKPRMKNATYSSAGCLSPLLNDPLFKTIGMGTRIFLGGGVGYVVGKGTQHNPNPNRAENGTPTHPAGTLALQGDLKGMNPKWIRGLSYLGYGVTLQVGMGIPIPMLNEEIARFCSVKDEDLVTQVLDYGNDYPNGIARSLGQVNYRDLRSGKIEVDGMIIPTSALSSLPGARQIAAELKGWIEAGKFELTQPVELLPSE